MLKEETKVSENQISLLILYICDTMCLRMCMFTHVHVYACMLKYIYTK